MELLKGSGIEPELGWATLSFGIGAIDAEQTGAILRFLDALLRDVGSVARFELDGTVASVADDEEFHRPPDDRKNYNVGAAWLAELAAFLRGCSDTSLWGNDRRRRYVPSA